MRKALLITSLLIILVVSVSSANVEKNEMLEKVMRDFDISGNYEISNRVNEDGFAEFNLTKGEEVITIIFNKDGTLRVFHAISDFAKKRTIDEKTLYDLSYLDDSYYKYEEFFDESDKENTVVYLKKSKYGTINYANSIRVDYDTDGKVISYSCFKDFIKDEEPKLTENEARLIADKYISSKKNLKNDSFKQAKLTVAERNHYYEPEKRKELDSETKELRMVYAFQYNNFYVYVDAITGEVIGGDEIVGNGDAGHEKDIKRNEVQFPNEETSVIKKFIKRIVSLFYKSK